jgi:hypothetical protein
LLQNYCPANSILTAAKRKAEHLQRVMMAFVLAIRKIDWMGGLSGLVSEGAAAMHRVRSWGAEK